MALSKQLTPTATLVQFCNWAEAQGYRVGEMHGFSTVHDVHMKNSWHYDKDANGFGKAADINHGVNGPAERAKLIVAMHYARSLGLATIFAWQGTAGVASGHQNHLHVDVGTQSNIGKGLIAATKVPIPKGVVVPGVNDGKAKSVATLAAEVIAGKHGTGAARKKALGSRYAAVQAEVNRHLSAKAPAKPAPKPKPPAKSVATLALEVIAGKHGSGDARRKALGSQYAAVQAEVNRRLNAKPAGKSVATLATEVIAGKHGTGAARRKALGSQYSAVQAEVNRRLRSK